MGERGSEAAGGGRPLKERRTGVRTRRARMRRMPAPARAQQAPGRTSTLGIAHHLKDYGRTGSDRPRTAEVAETYTARRGSGTERHDTPGSVVGKDSERPYT